jgi:polyribonucleotide nucleotidyltransferase
MDFKVTGTNSGITALQMDIKLGGVSLEFLEQALKDAKDAKLHILTLMEKAQESITISDALPKVIQFKVEPSKIFAIIGKAGSVIREITEKYSVSIDLDKDTGGVKVSGKDEKNINECVEHIKELSVNAKAFVKKEKPDFEKIYKVDDVLLGKVLRITDFGAFVELAKGAEGLLHISKISRRRVSNVNDVYNINDEVEVKILKVTKDRIELASCEF